MTVIFVLSFRNLLRHRGRLVINTLVVVIASSLLVMSLGQIGGINRTLTQSVTDTLTAHLTIKPDSAPVDFFQFESSHKLPLIRSGDVSELLEKLRQLPYVEAVSPRLRFGSLIGDDNRSSLAMVFAVDPEQESKVCPDLTKIVAPLKNQDDAVISPQLLKKTHLALDKDIVVFSETPNMSFSAAQFNLVDTIKTPVLIDDYINTMIFINIAAAKSLLYLDGEASEIVIRLKPAFSDKANQQRFRDDIQAMLGDDQAYLKVYTYSQVESSIENISAIASGLGIVQVGTILLVMLVTIMIFTSISLHERRFEIGTLMSIGMTPWRMTFMFLLEVLMKTGFGFLLGMVIGMLILTGINASGGIVAATQVDQFIYGGKQMYPVIETGKILFGGFLMIVVVLMTTLMSCYGAARQDPVALLNNHK